MIIDTERLMDLVETRRIATGFQKQELAWRFRLGVNKTSAANTYSRLLGAQQKSLPPPALKRIANFLGMTFEELSLCVAPQDRGTSQLLLDATTLYALARIAESEGAIRLGDIPLLISRRELAKAS